MNHDEEWDTFISDTDAWRKEHEVDRELFDFMGFWVPLTNYRACSLKILFLISAPEWLGGKDTAECSGNGGCSPNWHNMGLGKKDKLNRGCNMHDMCLENEHRHHNDPAYCCDEMLRRAADSCRWFGGGGLKFDGCSWRGCSWSKDCNDSRFVGYLTYLAMPAAGHDDAGCSNNGNYYWP